MSEREQTLIKAMKEQGYCCEPFGSSFTLRAIPIQPYINCSGQIPYLFKSVQSAADYLCPIVKDEQFTALVSA